MRGLVVVGWGGEGGEVSGCLFWYLPTYFHGW